MALQLKRDDEIRIRDNELGLPNGDEDTVYILRPLTKEILKEQHKARKSALRDARGPEAREALGDEADWLINYVLTDWEGVLWEGQPAPCTPEMRKWIDPVRVEALLRRAGLNQVAAAEEQRSQSFRSPA